MELTRSVIVCAHNEAGYLASCLYSLLAQSRPPDEIIVVNNASTDATGDVAARVPGVRVIAVATGPYAAPDLAGADAVVDDARALLPVLEDWATSLA